MGEQVQLVRMSRGWEESGSPWCFGGECTASEGEQDLGGQRGAPGVLGEQVQLVSVSQGWENWKCPWCLGEQLQVMRVSRGWEDWGCS